MREYHCARAIGLRAELTYLFFSQKTTPCPTADDLPFCQGILPVPAPRMYTFPKLVRGAVGRWPLPVVNYTSEGMRSSIRSVLRDQKFDLIHLDSIHMAAYVPLFGGNVPVVFNWHNIESEAMQRFSENAGSLVKKGYAFWTARRLAALEKSILRDAFGHLVCSERERAELQRIVPQARRVAVIENGVDVSFFQDAVKQSASRNRLVFVGSMGYHANSEAAVQFARQVWPQLREHFPQWRLTLVGADPPPAVCALREIAGVEVTGTVADVRPYYAEAIAAIVPLRTGGGTRLKILEAMAARVPVVSTPLGAEGLAITPGKDILLVSQEGDWLAALNSLKDSTRRESLIEAGYQLARSRYDWEIIGKSLFDTYREWLAEPE